MTCRMVSASNRSVLYSKCPTTCWPASTSDKDQSNFVVRVSTGLLRSGKLRHRQCLAWRVLENERDLEERRPAGTSSRLKGVHEPLEREVLVGGGLEDGLAHLSEETAKSCGRVHRESAAPVC